jgi:hypothetical protein
MGLLDDAIREHLDLQRRRGADPTEVERAEREALGPVRRAPESAPGADDEAHDPDGLEPGSADAESEALGAEALEAGPESEPAVHEPESLAPDPYEPETQVARPAERDPAFDQEADSWSYEDSQLEPGAAIPPPASAEPPLAEPPLAEPPLAEPAPAEPPPDEPPPYERPLAETEEDVFGDPPAAPPPHPARTAINGATEEYDVEAALNSEAKREGAGEEDEDVLEETPEFLQDTPDHDRLWFEQRPPKDFDFDG